MIGVDPDGLDGVLLARPRGRPALAPQRALAETLRPAPARATPPAVPRAAPPQVTTPSRRDIAPAPSPVHRSPPGWVLAAGLAALGLGVALLGTAWVVGAAPRANAARVAAPPPLPLPPAPMIARDVAAPSPPRALAVAAPAPASPAPAAPAAVEAPAAVVIPFAFDAHLPAQLDGLDALVAACDGRLEVVGHTCSLGTRDANLQVAMARARAVAASIVAAGVDPARLDVRSAGDAEPRASNDNRAGRALNRRAEVACRPVSLSPELR